MRKRLAVLCTALLLLAMMVSILQAAPATTGLTGYQAVQIQHANFVDTSTVASLSVTPSIATHAPQIVAGASPGRFALLGRSAFVPIRNSAFTLDRLGEPSYRPSQVVAGFILTLRRSANKVP